MISLMDCTTPSTILKQGQHYFPHQRKMFLGHYLVLDARVFSFGILPDEDGIDIVVRRLIAFDRHARPNICKEIERPTERQVE